MRRDVARNRAILLEAARTLFETDGLDVALEDVARAAGLSRTSLARHFPTRQELIAALWEVDVARLEEVADTVASEPDGLLRLFDHIVGQQVDRRSLHPTSSQQHSGELQDLVARIQRAIDCTLPASREAGCVRPSLTASDILVAIGMCASAITEAADRPHRHAAWVTSRRLVAPGIVTPDWAAAHPDRMA